MMKIEKVDKMETDIKEASLIDLIKTEINVKEPSLIDIKEASLIVFPLFLRTLEPEIREVLKEDGAVRSDMDEKIKKWAEITSEILNEFFSPDIFKGTSNYITKPTEENQAPNAIVLIRGILTEGLKNKIGNYA